MRLALLLLLTGCTAVSWTCRVPATVTLEDTKTTVKCPSDGKVVVIEGHGGGHSARPRDGSAAGEEE